MKRHLLLFLGLVITSYGQAQFGMIKLEKITEIKNSKLIVGLTGDEEMDAALIEAVKEFWTLSEIGEPMPLAEALAKTAEDPSITVIKTGTHVRSGKRKNPFDYWEYRYITKAKILQLFCGDKKRAFSHYIPAFGEGEEITDEILRFGVAAMNYQLTTMDEKQLKAGKIKPVYKTYTNELEDKTLLLLEGWMDGKTTAESLKEDYPGKAEIVSYKRWREAILNKEEGVAYSMICNVPIGEKYMYQHYLVEAKTGRVYAITTSMNAGDMSVMVGSAIVNLSKGSSGYITKKQLGKYSNALNGKW